MSDDNDKKRGIILQTSDVDGVVDKCIKQARHSPEGFIEVLNGAMASTTALSMMLSDTKLRDIYLSVAKAHLCLIKACSSMRDQFPEVDGSAKLVMGRFKTTLLDDNKGPSRICDFEEYLVDEVKRITEEIEQKEKAFAEQMKEKYPDWGPM